MFYVIDLCAGIRLLQVYVCLLFITWLSEVDDNGCLIFLSNLQMEKGDNEEEPIIRGSSVLRFLKVKHFINVDDVTVSPTKKQNAVANVSVLL